MAKQLTSETDEESGAILNLYDSFFPVFSENSKNYQFAVPEDLDREKACFFYKNSYKFNFEAFMLKPPIV